MGGEVGDFFPPASAFPGDPPPSTPPPWPLARICRAGATHLSSQRGSRRSWRRRDPWPTTSPRVGSLSLQAGLGGFPPHPTSSALGSLRCASRPCARSRSRFLQLHFPFSPPPRPPPVLCSHRGAAKPPLVTRPGKRRRPGKRKSPPGRETQRRGKGRVASLAQGIRTALRWAPDLLSVLLKGRPTCR